MIRTMGCILVAATGALLALPASAGEYAGFEGFYSSDADGTEIAKTSLDLDFRHRDSEHYMGLSLELAQFRPFGQPWVDDHRVYFRFADGSDRWKWNGRVGSDGDTVLGNASIHNEDPYRQEYFVEREIVETPLGLQRGLYSTYVGGAWDLPFNERNTLVTLLGVQDFSGGNVRLQYRGNFIHVVKPDWGLSAQLRVRYFHDSVPNQFDYYSPQWYAQAIPTLQLRRFVNGWRYAVAAGYGIQTDAAATSWHPARLLEASVTSPKDGRDWVFNAAFTYTNTPTNGGFTYDYKQLMLTAGRSF